MILARQIFWTGPSHNEVVTSTYIDSLGATVRSGANGRVGGLGATKYNFAL